VRNEQELQLQLAPLFPNHLRRDPVLATSDIRSKNEGYWYLYPFHILVVST
jgi:hypothetical protein